MFNLQGMRSAVLARLGIADEGVHISDALVEDALRVALVVFGDYGELRETSFTVPVTGYEVDVSALAPHRIQYIAYPWQDGIDPRERAIAFRVMDADTIRFDAWEVQQDEILRIGYLPRQQISGLDGAASTTLTETETERFVMLAAAYVLDSLMLRNDMLAVSDRGLALANRRLELLNWFYLMPGQGTRNPVWGQMGL
jgi:hypothetical protein